MVTPRGDLPVHAEAYRTIGPFDVDSLPAGLRTEHRLKAGAWGLIKLTEGKLRFVWDDEEGGIEELVAPRKLVVPPEAPHHVEGEGPFLLTITFYRS